METRRYESIAPAASMLRQGLLVAFPTETVFGLGADATNAEAIARLFAAKGRPSDNPLIVHIADSDRWELAARQMTTNASRLLAAFSPGPLTVVLPKHPSICELVTAGLDTIGLRIPNCEITREMLRQVNLPIAAPSANLSGRPSCTNWQSVLEDLEGRIDGILCQNPSSIGLESTVVDCCSEVPVMLRAGAVTLSDLQRIVPATRCMGNSVDSMVVNSPGLKHPHYRPNATLELWEPSLDGGSVACEDYGQSAYCGLAEHPLSTRFRLYRQYESLDVFAANFYEFLREADRRGASKILCQLAPDSGLGTALRDRQLRAAGMR